MWPAVRRRSSIRARRSLAPGGPLADRQRSGAGRPGPPAPPRLRGRWWPGRGWAWRASARSSGREGACYRALPGYKGPPSTLPEAPMALFGTDGIRDLAGQGALAPRAGGEPGAGARRGARARGRAEGGSGRAGGRAATRARAGRRSPGRSRTASRPRGWRSGTWGSSRRPVVAWWVAREGLDLGIAVSASHNPPEWNGLKPFVRGGGSSRPRRRPGGGRARRPLDPAPTGAEARPAARTGRRGSTCARPSGTLRPEAGSTACGWWWTSPRGRPPRSPCRSWRASERR